MDIPLQKAITTIEAIAASIKNDAQVYRWFSFLIVQSDVQQLFLQEKDISLNYSALKKTILFKRIMIWILFGLLIFSFFTKSTIFLLCGIPFIYPWIKNHYTQKNLVIQISMNLLNKDFSSQEISYKTLYQIAEIYSEKYHVPSLVDKIYTSDNISRRTIIFVFILTCYIYPQPFRLWQIYFTTFAAYILVSALLNTNLLYKNIK